MKARLHLTRLPITSFQTRRYNMAEAGMTSAHTGFLFWKERRQGGIGNTFSYFAARAAAMSDFVEFLSPAIHTDFTPNHEWRLKNAGENAMDEILS